jgi:hypothetical protein
VGDMSILGATGASNRGKGKRRLNNCSQATYNCRQSALPDTSG